MSLLLILLNLKVEFQQLNSKYIIKNINCFKAYVIERLKKMSLIGFVPVKQFVSKEADVAVNVLFVSDAVVVATSVGIVAFVCDTAVVGGGAVNMLFDSGTFFVGVAENVVFA